MYEITHTPNDATFDPNYNENVTIPIGSTSGPSPTTWFIDETNVSSVIVRIVRNNATTTVSGLSWGSTHRLYAGKHRQVLAERASGETIVLASMLRQFAIFFVARCTKEKKTMDGRKRFPYLYDKDDEWVSKGRLVLAKFIASVMKGKRSDNQILQDVRENYPTFSGNTLPVGKN